MASVAYTDEDRRPEGAREAARPKEDLAAKRRKFRAYEGNKEDEIKEQRESRRYYHGKQWTDAELRIFALRKQPVITDNRIARKVDFLVGVEQRMRRDPKAYPRNPADEQTADVATAAVRFVCDANRWEHKASRGALDGFIDGIGCVFVGIENRQTGPEPVIKSVQVDRFWYDPRSEQPDFSDARYMGLSLWLDIEEAEEQWPDADLRQYLTEDGGTGTFALEQDRAMQWGDLEHQRVRVVELWEKRREGWYFCKFCGDVELESGVSPYLDEEGRPDNPYVAWSPNIDERGQRYGLIRNMRSIQDEINHRRQKLLYMLNVKQVRARKGMIDDIEEVRRELAKADGLVEHEGVWGDDIDLIDQSQQIQGQAELLTQAQAALENLGPNPGLIGKGGGVADQSGRAILAQRDSGMTELSPVFDRLRDWKLRVYRAAWARIRQAWTAERWIRVTDDPDAAQFVGLNVYEQDPTTGQIQAQNVLADIDVDIIMEEGPDTITMQEEMLQTLAQLGEAAIGPLGKVIIELSNIPHKERLLKLMDESMAPDPQVAAMQAKLAEIEAMLGAAKVDKEVAETENKRADTVSKLLQVGAGPEVMAAFPLQYGQPSHHEMMMQPEPPMGGDNPMMAAGGAPDLPPDTEMIPPEQAAPGGLPLSPEAVPA